MNMSSESQLQNSKKIFNEELRRFLQKNDAEKSFDKIKKIFIPLLHKIFALACESQDVDEFYEKLETTGMYSEKTMAFLKYNIRGDPNLTYEENFRNGLRLGLNR